jgi:plastocyanin
MKLTAFLTHIIPLVLLLNISFSFNKIEHLIDSKEGLIASESKPQIIHIDAVRRMMKYSMDKFEVKAGKPVEIWFTNKDDMRHNLLIISPGSLEIVGKAADRIATSPKGVEKNWIPDIPEVLFAAPLIKLNETYKLRFITPNEPGNYPFVCTFPTHWRMMNGSMLVKK